MDIPEWAPIEVVSLWEEAQQDANQELEKWGDVHEGLQKQVDMLKRLITDDQMQFVWRRASQLPQQHKTSNAWFIGQEAIIAFIGPVSPSQRLTKGGREDFIEEVESTVDKLLGLIQDTELDEFHRHEHWNKKTKEMVQSTFRSFLPDNDKYIDCPECKKHHLSIERWGRSSFSETLTAFRIAIPDMILKKKYSKKPKIFLGHQDAKSDRAYFVKHMTQVCRDMFGQPLRKIVMTITNSAYPEAPIDERVVSRLTPDTKPSP